MIKELLKQPLPSLLAGFGCFAILASVFRVQDITKLQMNPQSPTHLPALFAGIALVIAAVLLQRYQTTRESLEEKAAAQGPTVRWHSQWRLSGREYRETLELSATAAGEVHGRRITVSDGEQKEFQVKGHRRGRFTWIEYHRDEGRGGGTIVLDEYTTGRLSGIVVAPNCDTGKLRVYQNRWVPEVDQMSYSSEWQRNIDEIEPCAPP